MEQANVNHFGKSLVKSYIDKYYQNQIIRDQLHFKTLAYVALTLVSQAPTINYFIDLAKLRNELIPQVDDEKVSEASRNLLKILNNRTELQTVFSIYNNIISCVSNIGEQYLQKLADILLLSQLIYDIRYCDTQDIFKACLKVLSCLQMQGSDTFDILANTPLFKSVQVEGIYNILLSSITLQELSKY